MIASTTRDALEPLEPFTITTSPSDSASTTRGASASAVSRQPPRTAAGSTVSSARMSAPARNTRFTPAAAIGSASAAWTSAESAPSSNMSVSTAIFRRGAAVGRAPSVWSAARMETGLAL